MNVFFVSLLGSLIAGGLAGTFVAQTAGLSGLPVVFTALAGFLIAGFTQLGITWLSLRIAPSRTASAAATTTLSWVAFLLILVGPAVAGSVAFLLLRGLAAQLLGG